MNTFYGPRVLEEYLDLRFREVKDLLGISTHNAVRNWIVFSVRGLGKERESRILKIKWCH